MKQDTADTLHGHVSYLCRLFSIVCLLLSHTASGRPAVVSGSAMRKLPPRTDVKLPSETALLRSTSRTFSRQLLTETNPALASSEGRWRGVEPCPALVELLTATPNAASKLGNFTEIPEPQVIRECSVTSGIYVLDGESLAAAIAEPTPLLKIMALSPSNPTVWPADHGAFNSAPGSVNILDCQDGLLDLRNRDFSLDREPATTVFSRCIVIYPDADATSTALTYWYDATAIFPCNGTALLSLQASVYDKETKAVFPELSANPGPGSTVHFRNGSIWCYDEPQLAELLLQYQGTPVSSDGPSASSWMPWLIATCVLLLLIAVGLVVWMCFGRPRCCCQPTRANTAKQTHRNLDNRSMYMGRDEPSIHYRSTEELAAALSTVLKTHRFTDDASSTTQSQDRALYALDENIDGGHPRHATGHMRGRYKPSLRVNSDLPSTSTATGETADGRHCTQYSAQGGSGGEASDPYDDLELPLRTCSGTSRARQEASDSRDFRTRHASIHGGPSGKRSTVAWVEDSLEARARLQLAGDVRLGPGRERFSDVDTMSYDDRCSDSISLAPHSRMHGGSSRASMLNAFIRDSDVRGSMGVPSERSQYCDAPDALSTGQSYTANSSPRLPQASPADSEELPRPSVPPVHRYKAFVVPGGSPMHPGLKQYDSPPATHPILGANSPRRPVSRGGNDQEGTR